MSPFSILNGAPGEKRAPKHGLRGLGERLHLLQREVTELLIKLGGIVCVCVRANACVSSCCVKRREGALCCCLGLASGASGGSHGNARGGGGLNYHTHTYTRDGETRRRLSYFSRRELERQQQQPPVVLRCWSVGAAAGRTQPHTP